MKKWHVVAKGVLVGVASYFLLFFLIAIISFKGYCGLSLGPFVGGGHTCTFLEYVSSTDGLILSWLLWATSLWWLAPIIVAISMYLVYWYTKRKRATDNVWS